MRPTLAAPMDAASATIAVEDTHRGTRIPHVLGTWGRWRHACVALRACNAEGTGAEIEQRKYATHRAGRPRHLHDLTSRWLAGCVLADRHSYTAVSGGPTTPPNNM